jgi:hypothetical protein
MDPGHMNRQAGDGGVRATLSARSIVLGQKFGRRKK